MSDQPLPSLTPHQHKALRNQHPLYKRLSGEGVWVFLEELGLDEEQCERFMDAFFRQMDHILSCMAALEADSFLKGWIAGRPEDCCSACASRIGRQVGAGSHVRLPPFGIGCPLSLHLAGAPAGEPSIEDSPLLPDMQEYHSVLCAVLASNPAAGLRRFLDAVQGSAPQIE